MDTKKAKILWLRGRELPIVAGKIGGVTGAEHYRWSKEGRQNRESEPGSHRWSHNLLKQIGLQDDYKQLFETKTRLPFLAQAV